MPEETPELPAQLNRYQAIIDKIFFDGYAKGVTEIPFVRTDIKKAAADLGIVLPENLGDVLYSVRYRTPMPGRVLATQPEGLEWIIDGTGRAKYAFRLVNLTRIRPNETLAKISIPDATPEIIRASTSKK